MTRGSQAARQLLLMSRVGNCCKEFSNGCKIDIHVFEIGGFGCEIDIPLSLILGVMNSRGFIFFARRVSSHPLCFFIFSYFSTSLPCPSPIVFTSMIVGVVIMVKRLIKSRDS